MTNDWKVIVVFDPEGDGNDFAYTVGLHDRGLPELFLWARPTDGDDPGVDWILSDLDLTAKLDELGTRLMNGTIEPGETTEATYDGGATRVGLVLQQPVAAHANLGTDQAHPSATICEVRWSLHRIPVGVRRELEPHEVEVARTRLAAFISADGAASVSFPASAEFGPHTPIVEVLRMQTRCLDDGRAGLLLCAVHLGPVPGSELAIIEQAARSVGLVDELERARDLATVDAQALCDRAFATQPLMIEPAARLFATIFATAYGAEIVRHATVAPPASSELVWALLDPDGCRTERFIDDVSRLDTGFARLVHRADHHALAALVEPLDDEVVADLFGLWVHAAAAGHGSGLWMSAVLICPTVTMDVTSRAGLALAVAGYASLDLHLPGELADVRDTIDELAAGVRATALRHAG